jgi:hypothetical protein
LKINTFRIVDTKNKARENFLPDKFLSLSEIRKTVYSYINLDFFNEKDFDIRFYIDFSDPVIRLYGDRGV